MKRLANSCSAVALGRSSGVCALDEVGLIGAGSVDRGGVVGAGLLLRTTAGEGVNAATEASKASHGEL